MNVRQLCCRWLLVAAVGVGSHGCNDRVVDRTPFLGTWQYDENAKIGCAGSAESQNLLGTAFTIRAGTSSDLELEVGCYCKLKMQINGLEAVSTGPQPCEQLIQGRPVQSVVNSFRFTIHRDGNGDEMVTTELTGRSTFVNLGTVVTCNMFIGAGTPTRSPKPSVDCGPDETAVGVIAFSATDPGADCPSSAGREGVTLVIDNESSADHDFCTHDSGARGEGLWVLPDSVKYPPPPCEQGRKDTGLGFCRVDGRLFKPTASSAGAEHGYAVLKLGTRCPEGSVEMIKRIDTDDVQGSTRNENNWIGHPSPAQEIGRGASTFVKMAFCFFPPAARPEDAMSDFPDLGVSYGVYHDFEGPQPAWVISKRWHYSDDEDSSSNSYIPSDPGDFGKIIENTNGDTVFDMARVR